LRYLSIYPTVQYSEFVPSFPKYRVWCFNRCKRAGRLWRRSNLMRCLYRWSTSSWDMACSGRAM
jgi:hypothetical protein